MISKSLGSSRKFRRLLDTAGALGEFAQTLYPLLVAHSDDFGREDGDAFTVKHAVFPISLRSEEEFEAALVAMDDAQLIRRHTFSDGRTVLQIEDFDEHQTGLHKRTTSRFPELPERPRKGPEPPASGARVELNGTEPNRTEPSGEAGTKPPATEKPPVHQFFDRFADGFEELAGQKPEFDRGKDAKLAQELIRTHGLELVLDNVDAFFQSRDEWIRSSGYTVGAFKASFNKLTLARQRRVPGRAPPETATWRQTCKARGHETVCSTPTQCDLKFEKAQRGAA